MKLSEEEVDTGAGIGMVNAAVVIELQVPDLHGKQFRDPAPRIV